MLNISKDALATMVLLWALVPMLEVGQEAPDFSGEWVLEAATVSGGGRTASGTSQVASGTRKTTSNAISGAAFNCGRGCTILHKRSMLTVDSALLASNPTPAAAVTMQLNGRSASVVDSFNPGREIPVTAKWNGKKLEILSTGGSHTVTQLVSLEAGQLVVVTSGDRDGDSPVTFTYRKK